MKSIKKIADEIGVSKQAIFYHMKKPPLSSTIDKFTQTIDGVLMVDSDGENLIKQALSKDNTVKQVNDKNTSSDKELISFLQNLVKEQQETIKCLSESIKTERQNLLAEKVQKVRKLRDSNDNSPAGKKATLKERAMFLIKGEL